MDTEWESCGFMSIVEFGKLEQNNRANEYRANYKGQFVDIGWIGFFYRAVADPNLFVTLYSIGDHAPIAKVDKMIPCLFVYERPCKIK